MKNAKTKAPKATHTVEFDFIYVTGKRARSTAKLWNWHIRAANGELIAYSNQSHSRKIDAKRAVRNFLDAVKKGTVQVGL